MPSERSMAAVRKMDWVGLGGDRTTGRESGQEAGGRRGAESRAAAEAGAPATEQEPHSKAEPTGKLLGRAWGLREEPKSRL